MFDLKNGPFSPHLEEKTTCMYEVNNHKKKWIFHDI